MTDTLVKSPSEALAAALPFAAAVASITSIDVEERGLVPGAVVLIATAAIGAPGVQAMLTGGSDGERYRVVVQVATAAGDALTSELDVAVIEPVWTLPGGGVPWLSIRDFIDQVGYPETLAMTDASGAGRIDRDLLTRSLAAAQATAESFLAARYQLPLAQVPPLLAVTVADLACGRLYPRGAPDGIKANAAAAMALLGRLQAGTASLAIAGVAPAASTMPDAPVVSIPGRRVYSDDLAGYASDRRWRF